MAFEIIMPQLGLTMTEGTVTRWFKQVGDAVKVGELFFEVATDKITNQVEATNEGTLLEIRVAEGKVAPVKAVLALVGAAGESVVSSSSLAQSNAGVIKEPVTAAAVPATATSQGNIGLASKPAGDGWVKASPAARKAARDKGIDIAAIIPGGPEGRVVERDVLAFAEKAPKEAKASPMAAKLALEQGISLSSIAKDGRIMKEDVSAAGKAAAPVTQAPAGTVTTQPIVGMRKVIADRMSLSWQTAPHVHLSVEVDMTEVLVLKGKLAKASGQKTSVTEIIVKCAAQVLREIPIVNARIADNRIVFPGEVNIGVAVALDNGLIVPVVRGADRKSIREIRELVVDLGTRARAGRLNPDEISGGTFTVTNLGMFGTDHFTPVINPPESAILGVCRTVEKPVAVNGAVVVRPMCNFVLGFDHRIIDGAVGARFMARFREFIENPLLLLVG